MCAVDGMRHGSHGVYAENQSENYPLERAVQRDNNPYNANMGY